MKRLSELTLTLTMAFALVTFFSTNSFAQDTGDIDHGLGFIDADGDGYNDNAPDSDGDGIPNGMDEDFVKQSQMGRGFVDADGDGINDNAMDDDGDGIPNGQDDDFVRPEDGSGRKNGQGQGKGMKGSGSGTGDCDGTGSKGKGKGRN